MYSGHKLKSRQLYLNSLELNVTFIIQTQNRAEHPQACITMKQNFSRWKIPMHCIGYSTWHALEKKLILQDLENKTNRCVDARFESQIKTFLKI